VQIATPLAESTVAMRLMSVVSGTVVGGWASHSREGGTPLVTDGLATAGPECSASLAGVPAEEAHPPSAAVKRNRPTAVGCPTTARMHRVVITTPLEAKRGVNGRSR
jgi:hypothetical protein